MNRRARQAVRNLASAASVMVEAYAPYVDPATADLDDEQPVTFTVRTTLGEVRRAQRSLFVVKEL